MDLDPKENGLPEPAEVEQKERPKTPSPYTKSLLREYVETIIIAVLFVLSINYIQKQIIFNLYL